MKNLQKNLLLSAASYVLLVISAFFIVRGDIPASTSAALFSIIGIFFSVRSFRKKESRVGAIVLILIGIIILLLVSYDLFWAYSCSQGGMGC